MSKVNLYAYTTFSQPVLLQGCIAICMQSQAGGYKRIQSITDCSDVWRK